MNRDTLITILFGVAFVVAGALTFTGKATAVESFAPVLAGFLGWIVKAPDFFSKKPSPPKSLGVLLVLGASALLSLGSPACTPAARRDVVNTILDVLDTACVLYQAEAGQPEEAILTICRIDKDLAPEVRRLIAAQRKAAAMKQAAASRDGGSDGGADAGSK